MSASSPDSFFKPLLAAYVDCELDDAARQRVEQWLATHPEAAKDLRAQLELSPGNQTLWETVEPVEPGAAEWALVSGRIAAELGSAPAAPGRSPRRFGWAWAGVAAGGVAAAVAWVGFALTAPPPHAQPPGLHEQESASQSSPALAPAPRGAGAGSDPIADFAVIPLAAEDDVVLDRVPDLHGGWLPIGQHPVPGVLTLATEDDVLLEDVSPNAAWPVDGGPRMTMTPGDAPMIYAAKSR